jgi:hypothetical protein
VSDRARRAGDHRANAGRTTQRALSGTAALYGSGKALDWAYKLEQPAQAVDQRVKIPSWMKHFEAIGGKFFIHEAAVAEDLSH